MRADLDVTVALAHALLAEQHPDLASLPLTVAANGWDNVMVRAGDDLVLRLPRRAVAAPLLANELAALPVLAPLLAVAVPDVAVPSPVRTGTPSEALGYPWPWSVLPWVDGVRAAATPVGSRLAWAPTLGRFLAALHRPVADGVPVPHNPFRGVALRDRRPPALDLAGRAGEVWRAAVTAPAYEGPPVWIHGDPHPANLVVAPGGGPGGTDLLAAVVDFGDVTAGDPASDLGTLWLTFDAAGRHACRAAMEAAGVTWDDATWTRARGWALVFAAAMLAHPDEHPALVPIGTHGLAALLDGA
ncbi:aminoglycoside phosphotransferase family protein [Xylanimonas protaetiae]|uniref:Aminoglycoside phosphotransferase family protein n=1 Tax=Xylanimonas protaetiae TaxID=2509457 RepID=A0A4P6FAB5_9MICO|nr:aminoglycoside phosphotransferase family protein [Xylanimonas protaetiae]QAY71229.1 aminoglycoside phosphotransferase family protein [Xylanimonas protaetiae]